MFYTISDILSADFRNLSGLQGFTMTQNSGNRWYYWGLNDGHPTEQARKQMVEGRRFPGKCTQVMPRGDFIGLGIPGL